MKWTDDIPEDARVDTSTHHGNYFWEVTGRAGHWCIVRRHVWTARAERSIYYPNITKAHEVFKELTTE